MSQREWFWVGGGSAAILLAVAIGMFSARVLDRVDEFPEGATNDVVPVLLGAGVALFLFFMTWAVGLGLSNAPPARAVVRPATRVIYQGPTLSSGPASGEGGIVIDLLVPEAGSREAWRAKVEFDQAGLKETEIGFLSMVAGEEGVR